MDKKLIATIRADHRENVANLVTLFFEEADERSKINIENEVGTVELVFCDRPPARVVKAMGTCGVITLNYSGIVASEPVVENTTVETEVSTKKEKKAKKKEPEKSEEELTRLKEMFDRDVKTIIETEASVSELGERLGRKFKLSNKPILVFKKYLEYALGRVSTVSMETIKEAMINDKCYPERWETDNCIFIIRKTLRKNGYNENPNLWEILNKIAEHRKSMFGKSMVERNETTSEEPTVNNSEPEETDSDEEVHEEPKVEEVTTEEIQENSETEEVIPEVVSNEGDSKEVKLEETKSEETSKIDSIEKILDSIDANLSVEEKVKYVFSTMKELVDTKFLPELAFDLLIKSEYLEVAAILKNDSLDSDSISHQIKMKVSCLVNGFIKQYGGDRIHANEFIEMLRKKC